MVDCLLVVAGDLQEVCADGVEAVVAGEALVKLVEERKPRLGTVGHRGLDPLREVGHLDAARLGRSGDVSARHSCASRNKRDTRVQRIGLLGRRTTEHVAGKSGGLADA